MAEFLRIFRMGLGRDSIAGLGLLETVGLLCGGVLIRPEDIDILVFTDTGAEWEKTYQAWPFIKAICDRLGIRAIVQEKPELAAQAAWLKVLAPVRERLAAEESGSKAYWSIRAELQQMVPPWQVDASGSIEEKAARGYYHRRVAIFEDYKSKESLIRFSDGGCTENHKILPNRRLLDDLSQERWGLNNTQWGNRVKKGLAEPHQVLLFIAKDESGRCIDDLNEKPFYERSVYPLVEMGIAKADEQAILDRMGLGWVQKSGCVGCKYQGVEHFWALSQEEPVEFDRIEDYEDTAADKNPKMVIFPKMKGRPRIREAIRRWREGSPLATVKGVLARDYKRNDRRGRPAPRSKDG